MRTLRLLAPLLLILVISSCKKDIGSQNAPVGFTPAAVPARYGTLQPNTNSLMLHAGDHVTVTVKVYNADGTISTATPSLQWESTNPAAATAATGVITAIAAGESQVTVSDGTHGSGYISVSVLPDTVALPSGPVSIVFDAVAVSCATGTQTALPSYTVTDAHGQVVSVQPTFEVRESSGLAVSGTDLTASASGIYHVAARYNGTLLSGGLTVGAHTAGSSTPDTSYAFSLSGDFPYIFYQYGAVAKPLKIRATAFILVSSNPINFKMNTYETSPDAVTIAHPDVVTQSGGLLQAVYTGGTEMTISYRSARITCHSIVMPDMTGNWGGTLSGTTYNFCIDAPTLPIRYTGAPGYGFGGGDDGGGGLIPNTFASSQSVTAYVGATCPAYYDCRIETNDGPLTAGAALGDGIYFQRNGTWSVFSLRLTSDKSKVSVYGSNLSLTKGTGNCTGSGGGGGSTLQSTLLGKSLWVGNSCWLNDAGLCTNNLRFNANNTLTAEDVCNGNTSHSANWAVNTVNSIQEVVIWSGTDTLELPVASYTSSSITFSDTEYGCTLLWTGQ